MGEALKTRCSPATRVPCRSFFETTPDRRSSVPPSPSAGETFAAWTREGSARSAFLLRSWDPPPPPSRRPLAGVLHGKEDPGSTITAGRPASPGSGDPRARSPGPRGRVKG